MSNNNNKRDVSLITLTPPRVARLTRASKAINASDKEYHGEYSERILRSCPTVTCCDFGRNRIISHPGIVFCHPCKMWDDRDMLNKKTP